MRKLIFSFLLFLALVSLGRVTLAFSNSDEDFCHQLEWTQNNGCQSDRCEALTACPICLGGFTCHARGFHKPEGTKYEPPLDMGTEVRKIEISSTGENVKRVEIKDEKGVVKPAESTTEYYVIVKDPEKCQPTPCRTLTAKIEGNEVIIGDGETETKTALPIKIEEDRITVKVEGQDIKLILPSEAKKIVEMRPEILGPLPTKINKIELADCISRTGFQLPCDKTNGVYKIELEKENRFLGLVSVKSKFNYEVSAGNGNVTIGSKPWYLRLVPFLFSR